MKKIIIIRTRRLGNTYEARVDGGRPVTCRSGHRAAALAWLSLHENITLSQDSPRLVSPPAAPAWPGSDRTHTYRAPQP